MGTTARARPPGRVEGPARDVAGENKITTSSYPFHFPFPTVPRPVRSSVSVSSYKSKHPPHLPIEDEKIVRTATLR